MELEGDFSVLSLFFFLHRSFLPLKFLHLLTPQCQCHCRCHCFGCQIVTFQYQFICFIFKFALCPIICTFFSNKTAFTVSVESEWEQKSDKYYTIFFWQSLHFLQADILSGWSQARALLEFESNKEITCLSGAHKSSMYINEWSKHKMSWALRLRYITFLALPFLLADNKKPHKNVPKANIYLAYGYDPTGPKHPNKMATTFKQLEYEKQKMEQMRNC